MKLLLIGDPHLKITRFDAAKQFLQWLNSTIQLHKPDLVVNLGDTFDTHAVLRSEIMAELMAHVNLVVGMGIPYVYVLGNHDMYKPNDSKYHALSALKGKIKNFYVVDEPQNLFDITFVPYIHNAADFPKNSLELCIAHQTFKGADFGDITTKEGVDADSVSCSFIISGHIHKRQRYLSAGGKTILYPGTPFSQSASDINQVKGISLFDTDTYRDTLIECPLPAWRGIRFEISPQCTIEDMHQQVKTLDPKDHWVLEIKGRRAEITGYLSSKEYKKAIAGIDVKVKTDYTDNEKRSVRINAMSMDQIVSEYIVKIYSGSLDKEELKQASLKILEAAGK